MFLVRLGWCWIILIVGWLYCLWRRLVCCLMRLCKWWVGWDLCCNGWLILFKWLLVILKLILVMLMILLRILGWFWIVRLIWVIRLSVGCVNWIIWLYRLWLGIRMCEVFCFRWFLLLMRLMWYLVVFVICCYRFWLILRLCLICLSVIMLVWSNCWCFFYRVLWLYRLYLC